MDARPAAAQRFSGFVPHLVLSIFIACAMLLAGWLQFTFHRGQAANLILLIAIAVSGIPLCIELFSEVCKAKLQCRYARRPVHRHRSYPAAVLGCCNSDFNALWRQGSRRVRRAASVLGIGRTLQTHAADCAPGRPRRLHTGRSY